MEAMYSKPIINIILNEKKLRFFSKIRNKTNVYSLNTLAEHNVGNLSQSNKAKRK